jgi:hypothetical protein
MVLEYIGRSSHGCCYRNQEDGLNYVQLGENAYRQVKDFNYGIIGRDPEPIYANDLVISLMEPIQKINEPNAPVRPTGYEQAFIKPGPRSYSQKLEEYAKGYGLQVKNPMTPEEAEPAPKPQNNSVMTIRVSDYNDIMNDLSDLKLELKHLKNSPPKEVPNDDEDNMLLVDAVKYCEEMAAIEISKKHNMPVERVQAVSTNMELTEDFNEFYDYFYDRLFKHRITSKKEKNEPDTLQDCAQFTGTGDISKGYVVFDSGSASATWA